MSPTPEPESVRPRKGAARVAARAMLSIGVFVVTSVLVLATLLAISFWPDTAYAPGYSEAAFASIEVGATEDAVLAALGQPLASYEVSPSERWLYCPSDHSGYRSDDGLAGTFTELTFALDGRLERVFGSIQTDDQTMQFGDGANHLGLTNAAIEELIGLDRAAVRARFGEPQYTRVDHTTRVLRYTESPTSTHYFLRKIGIDATGRVARKWSYFYVD